MRELQVYSKPYQERVAILLGCLLLFLINAAIAWPLFHLEYGNHMGSVEGAYIALGKYFAVHGYSLTWFPLWYSGEPLHNTYPPLVHWITEWTMLLTGWSAARSYHFMTAVQYCLGPITGFLLAMGLSRRPIASFAGGLLYSIVNISPILIREVRADVGGRWLSRRIQVLETYGEGPHMLTLLLLPLAILFLHGALTRKRPLDYALAAFGLAAVLFSNVLGALAILLSAFAYLITRDDLQIGDWIRTAALGILAYLIVCAWVPPSMMAVISERARFVGGDFTEAYKIAPVVFPLLFLAAVLVAYGLRRFNISSAVSFFCVSFFFFAVLTLPGYWKNIALVPMPKRYHPELDLLFPFIVTLSLSRLPWNKFPRAVPVTITVLLSIATLVQVSQLNRQTRRISDPVDITKTSEYKIAKQLSTYGLTGRVFAAGSDENWMNVFYDIPQFGGGFVQAIPNFNTNVASYLIESSDGGPGNPADSVLWMQAFGVARIAVTGPGSGEYYKPFQNPEKFKGLLQEIWHDGGDSIWQVPLKTESLVHVLPRESLVVTPPLNGIDVKEISRYVDALLKEEKLPAMHWETPARARIHANLQANDAISVQISNVVGWNARIGQDNLPVQGDGLGLIKLLPNRTGDVDVTLEYDGGIEGDITKAVSWTAILGTICGAIALEVLKRRKADPTASPVLNPVQ